MCDMHRMGGLGFVLVYTCLVNPPPYVGSLEANAVLERLVPGVQRVLGSDLVGLYLFGSLAVGDFDAANSDIDFVAVTADEVDAAQLSALQAFHAELFASGLPLADQVEGAYLSRAALRVYDPATARHPHIDRGEDRLLVKPFYSDWVVQRYSLREHGVALVGPPIHSLIQPITPSMLRAAVLDLLHFWWAPMLADTSHLQHSGYQAYAVATCCRMLYTLEQGGLVSKPAAGRWAQAHVDARFAPLIQRALAYQLRPDDIPATQDLLRYTLARSRRWEAGTTADAP
jgi:hypothetical protein